VTAPIPSLETSGLGRRFGRTWALRDCSLSLRPGQVVALVGPNGAGKTTRLRLAVGLARPTSGSVRVFGEAPRERPATLARLAFIGQDKPLYRGFTVAETLRMGSALNPRWDQAMASGRLRRLGIPLDRKVGKLSGGQRAQVALTMALAKRAELLLLDEPLANLDPLMRHEFVRGLMEQVAATGATVVLSSHVIADLEDVCDHLVLLGAGRVQVAGEIEAVLGGHRLLTGPRDLADRLPGSCAVVSSSLTDRQASLLVRCGEPVHDPRWSARPVGLEELVLAYMRRPHAIALPGPALAAVGEPDDRRRGREASA
jgi:ABC-2 type transport system ATP-binding protein